MPMELCNKALMMAICEIRNYGETWNRGRV